MMKHVIGATVLASALLLGTGAQAMPAAPAPSQTIQDDLIQVRDGCGGGRHFSPALGRCVLNYGVYGAPGYYGGGVYRGGVYRGGYAYRGGVYRGGRYGYRGGYRGGGGRVYRGGGRRVR
ncbi:hypothetical protein [Bradyrhizobium sp. SYSU BS000235]|uniref:hypothetical protein n=1 Tax=Bradyrhizobium sp. SYSU BS000235 TaxID=3411332 RepID=UPI003C77004F